MVSSMKRRSKQYGKSSKRGLTALIKKTVESLSERKFILSSDINLSISQTAGSAPTTVNLCPRLAQGTSQNQRVGNEVRIASAIMRGHVGILPYNATTNPIGAPALVKIWICRYKSANTNSILQTNADSAFFDNGATSIGFQATIGDMTYFPNMESWEILETKSFKLGAASTSVPFPTGTNLMFDNSPSIVPFSFDYAKHLKGPLRYEDNTTTVCTNKNLFFIVEAVYSQGNATSGLTIAELAYNSRVEYYDL